MIYLDDAIDVLADYIKKLDRKIGMGYLTVDDCKCVATNVLAGLSSAESEPDNLHPKVDPNFSSCSHCVHDEDSEEICILRKCVHAIHELKECYTERRQNG